MQRGGGARRPRAEAEQEPAREAQVDLLGRMAALQNARESVTGNAERAGGRPAEARRRARGARARARARREALREARGRAASEAEALLARLVRASATRPRRARARGAGRRPRRWRARPRRAQSERDGLAGRLSSLEEIVATHAAFDEGVRALLARPEGLDVLGVVADAVETDSAHERAVEAFLGDRLQAVLVPDAAHAVRGVRYLEDVRRRPRRPSCPLASAAHARRVRARCATWRAQEPKARGPAERPLSA